MDRLSNTPDTADLILTNLNKANLTMDNACDILLGIIKENPHDTRLFEVVSMLSQERVNLTSCIAFTAENIPSRNLEGNVMAAQRISDETREKDQLICTELSNLARKEEPEQGFSLK